MLTAFTLCSDPVLAEAIGRLSARLERLDRDPSARAAAEGLNVAAVLDQALDERERRKQTSTTEEA